MHRDGRPFTDEEAELLGTATDEDMRAAARELAAAPDRLTELFLPYIRTVAEEMGDRPATGGARTGRYVSSGTGLRTPLFA